MEPLNFAGIIAVALGFLLYATIVGNPVRKLLLPLGTFEGQNGNFLVRWVASLVTGLAVIPLVFLTLGLVPGLAGPWTAWILILAALALNGILYRRVLRRLPDLMPRARQLLGPYERALVVLAILIFVLHLSPLSGLWTTPGDDAKLYSLITERFIATQGTPQTWGNFADPSWYQERTHLLVPGFSGTVASAVYLFGVDVSDAVSVITSVFRILPSVTLYVLVLTLTRRKLPAILTMGIYGLIIVEPIVGWFQWGGMAELSAIALLPVAAAGVYVLGSPEARSARYVLWLAIVIAGMSLLHPFAFFYLLAFAIPLTLLAFWEHRGSWAVWIWLPVIVGLGLAALPVAHAFGPESAISPLYSSRNPGWTPLASWSMNLATIGANVMWRAITVYGAPIVLLLFVSLTFVRDLWRQNRESMLVLTLWFAGMFFLHENNPNGLWVVPFPLWYRIDANRTFGVTSLIAAAVGGLILERILLDYAPPLSSSAAPLSRRHLRSVLAQRRKCAGLLVLVVVFAAQLVANGALLYDSRSISPITADDAAAFAWIQNNTPTGATFFVNWADAGSWIPIFAGRRVVMPFGVVTNYSLLDSYDAAVSAFASDPASPTALAFLQSTGVTYVYAGPARIYGRVGFDPVLINATASFRLVYHRGAVWIFGSNQTVFSMASVNDSRSGAQAHEMALAPPLNVGNVCARNACVVQSTVPTTGLLAIPPLLICATGSAHRQTTCQGERRLRLVRYSNFKTSRHGECMQEDGSCRSSTCPG